LIVRPKDQTITSIYDPSRHEPLAGEAWNPDNVREEIGRIIADFQGALRRTGDWPTHPLDDETRKPKWALYAGAAGALVSLRLLQMAGYAAGDPTGLLRHVHACFLECPDYGYETGLQLGEIGILTPAVLADPDDRAMSDRLAACMKATLGHPAREITSGETGMMHAALTLFRKTRNDVWKDLYLAGARSLWETWTQQPERSEWLWNSRIFGSVRRYYGACHGIAGNAQVFLRATDILPAEWIEAVVQRTTRTLSLAASREGSHVNWPLCAEPDSPGNKRLVQWCHGAAGIVTALGCARGLKDTDSRELDVLIDDAAEFVWEAGPLRKGPGLCHGTAGNGYAFLTLYRFSGEERWLHRARRFAMHAIRQSRQTREQHGQGRYTLWTGDGGLAVYLHHCLMPEQSSFPGLEIF
jgi:hypothetical protein